MRPLLRQCLHPGWPAALALAVALGALASPALAQSSSGASADVEGSVVALESGELVVDLGQARGASDGDVVELWRPMKVKHPVTGKTLVDRFRIGSLRLTQVRKTLSLATVEGTPSRPPAAGDVVVLHRAQAPQAAQGSGKRPVLPPGSTAEQPPSSASSPGGDEGGAGSLDAESRELIAIFDSLRGADPVARIKRYEDHVRAHPNGKYAVVLYEEAQSLRRLYAPSTGGAAKASPGQPDSMLAGFAHPQEALAGVPLTVGVELRGAARGAVIHVRGAGEVAYTSLPMASVGQGYFAVTVPADKIVAPSLAYFIEATTDDGSATAVVGGAQSPRVVQVEEIPRPEPPRRLDATAAVWTDYAIYNLKKNNDHVFQTEGYFGFRLGDQGVRAARSGFGVYRGVGGTLKDLDELGKDPRSVGLTYGYLEGEYAFVPTFSVVGRAVIGLRDDGVGGGGQAYVRIGHDRRTNLLFGGEFLGGIGLRGITELAWNTIPNVPIVLRLEVTNQPAGVSVSRPVEPVVTPGSTQAPSKESLGQGEVGARAIVQVGYRVVPQLVIAARGSYQGRTINHAGPGFGAAVTYEW